jgi:hypothetical protein
MEKISNPGLNEKQTLKKYKLLGADRKPIVSDSPGTYGGHRGTKIYGRMDCRAALRALERGGYEKYRVFFADEQTAIAAGYRPCGVCLRDKYAIWKQQNLKK